MAVVIKTKPKGKGKQQPAEAHDAIEALVDSIGFKQDELVQLMEGKIFQRARALEGELGKMQEALIIRANELMADDEEREVTGETHKAKIGMKAIKREITDLVKVRKFMGNDAFFKVAKLNLKDADAYLNPEQKTECITSERTGNRKFTVKSL